jgi:hypothetical protein
MIRKTRRLTIISEIETLADDDEQPNLFNKCYRSAGYWGGSVRTNADRRAIAAAAAAGRPRTSGFADVIDRMNHINAMSINHEIESRYRLCTKIDVCQIAWELFVFVRTEHLVLIISRLLAFVNCECTKSILDLQHEE